MGRLMETIPNAASNTSLSIGAVYKPGIYYIEIIQEDQRKLVQVVKE